MAVQWRTQLDERLEYLRGRRRSGGLLYVLRVRRAALRGSDVWLLALCEAAERSSGALRSAADAIGRPLARDAAGFVAVDSDLLALRRSHFIACACPTAGGRGDIATGGFVSKNVPIRSTLGHE